MQITYQGLDHNLERKINSNENPILIGVFLHVKTLNLFNANRK